MNKLLTVARREFLETVKSKIFILNLFLTPALVVGGIFLSTRMTQKSIEGPRPVKTVVVTDRTGELSDELTRTFERQNRNNPQRQVTLKSDREFYPLTGSESREVRQLSAAGPSDAETQELKNAVQRGEIAAYAVIARDAITSGGKSVCYVKAKNVVDLQLYESVEQLINNAVVNFRFRSHNLPEQLYAELHRWVPFEQVDVSGKTEEKREPFLMLLIPFFFIFLMFIGIVAVNQQILTSVIEEKSSRVIEVILSSVSPFQLMAGKIVGLAVAGLLLVFLWGATAYGAAAWRGMTGLVRLSHLGWFVLYYVLGFLLMASILAAIGSVCNTMKDAQSMMMPVMLIFTVPMIVWFNIAQHPAGTLAVVLSLIPPITPMIMMLRIAADPELPWVQIAVSLAILGLSVPGVMWASAKIFRTGILMYGKPPSPREILRWLRYS